MTSPKTLARPLAQRAANLATPTTSDTVGPDIPSNVIEAAVAALARGETHYTDRPGIPELRTLVAEQLGRQFGLAIDPKEVTITCGSTEARFVTMTLFVEAGTQVLCLGDVSQIQGAAHLVGAELIASVDDPKNVSLVYLTPDDEATEVSRLLQQAQTHGWWIIWDMSFADRHRNFHPGQLAELTKQVVTINTLSENMPGWRIGWMAGSEAALRLRSLKQAITICTTNVSQWAALEYVRVKLS